MTRIRRSTIALVLAAGLPMALPASPAGAHAGGRAQLYVDSVRLEPQAGGWLAALVVRDADSGEPQPGFGVQLTGSGPDGTVFGPVGLADPDADGRYAAAVPLEEGAWSLTVEADEVPGGARAVSFTKTWPVTLQAGQPVDLAGFRPPPRAREPEGHPAVRSMLGLSAAAALASLLLTRRRRARWPGGRSTTLS